MIAVVNAFGKYMFKFRGVHLLNVYSTKGIAFTATEVVQQALLSIQYAGAINHDVY